MKKLYLFLLISLNALVAAGQQLPLSENYFMDKYSLSPSYAGNYNPKYLFMGYRSDWTGIDGGPQTLRISYNDLLPFMQKAGYGAKIIYDKSGIFNQLFIMGTYSYNLMFNDDNHLIFGLSMGVYKNRLNLLDYYNDPKYSIDPSLVSLDIKSSLKFVSDFSALWTWKDLEAGALFSNIGFGYARYKDVDLKYNPLYNFQLHGMYHINISDSWDVSPLLILRGGKDIKMQAEFSAQVMYLKRFMVSCVYRDQSVLGFGIGANIAKGLKFAYNFNFATNVALNAFNNHELSLGVNIFEYTTKKEKAVVTR